MMKIDVFTHILPSRYLKAIVEKGPTGFRSADEATRIVPSLTDMDVRFRIMDKYEDLLQVLTISLPPVESFADPARAADLARIANDEMAELVRKYPDKFAAAIACLPMNNVEAALQEVDRAITDLKFRGIQIFTTVNGKPLDSPEFTPLYEKMSYYNLPILLHPRDVGIAEDTRTMDAPPERVLQDPAGHIAYRTFEWPFESTIAMSRFVFSGILERLPNLKIITHHCGGMVPYFAKRIAGSTDVNEMRKGFKYPCHLTKKPLEYYRMFYNDTAVYGNTAALMCGYAFCGADHLLFATDMPYDSQLGDRYIRETIRSVQEMNISDSEKEKVFALNAVDLLRLPIM